VFQRIAMLRGSRAGGTVNGASPAAQFRIRVIGAGPAVSRAPWTGGRAAQKVDQSPLEK